MTLVPETDPRLLHQLPSNFGEAVQRSSDLLQQREEHGVPTPNTFDLVDVTSRLDLHHLAAQVQQHAAEPAVSQRLAMLLQQSTAALTRLYAEGPYGYEVDCAAATFRVHDVPRLTEALRKNRIDALIVEAYPSRAWLRAHRECAAMPVAEFMFRKWFPLLDKWGRTIEEAGVADIVLPTLRRVRIAPQDADLAMMLRDGIRTETSAGRAQATTYAVLPQQPMVSEVAGCAFVRFTSTTASESLGVDASAQPPTSFAHLVALSDVSLPTPAEWLVSECVAMRLGISIQLPQMPLAAIGARTALCGVRTPREVGICEMPSDEPTGVSRLRALI